MLKQMAKTNFTHVFLDARHMSESAFRDRYPEVVIPARTHLETSEGIFLMMPCHDRRGQALGRRSDPGAGPQGAQRRRPRLPAETAR